MRLADAVLRRGHLSDQALAELCMTGERPAHLDRCDQCADRAVELGRWLDGVRAMGLEGADAMFPPERLAAQQAQILRRLEQLDHPARVIAFPAQSRYGQAETVRRRIAPAWVGLAAAAGLMLGVVGGELTGRFARQAAVTPDASMASSADSTNREALAAVDASLVDASLDIPFLDAMDQLTPHAIDALLTTPVPHR